MDTKKVVVFGLLALTVLTMVAPAGAWFGPFGGCGFGCGFPFFRFGFFGCAVPVPVPVPVAAPVPAAVPVAAPVCAPEPCGVGASGCGLGVPGPCGFGAPGLGISGCGWGNNPAIPGPI